MSDTRPTSQEHEARKAARTSSTSIPRLPVRSAARASAPLQGTSRRGARQGLKEQAADAVLNAFAIIGEMVDDFRSADRFFKYKALVLVLWLASAIGAFGVACPAGGPSNTAGARLVVGGDRSSPAYMVKNASDEPWQDVEILVNGKYRSTLVQLEPQGTITISPAVIFDTTGTRAPSDLRVTDIEVRVGEPEGGAVLLKAGEAQKE